LNTFFIVVITIYPSGNILNANVIYSFWSYFDDLFPFSPVNGKGQSKAGK
jgi:hypothetical protein